MLTNYNFRRRRWVCTYALQQYQNKLVILADAFSAFRPEGHPELPATAPVLQQN